MALAQSLQNDKALHEAIAEYEKVVAQNPDNTVALNNLAWAYYLEGDARATEIARLAFAQRPDSGAVADTLGWILLENNRIDEAVQVLEKAVQLSNGRAEVRYHYAVGLSKQGNQDEARLILQDIVANENNFASREEAVLFLEKL
jgi:predicted Zn-dependent protease